jgi:hypothetical protein
MHTCDGYEQCIGPYRKTLFYNLSYITQDNDHRESIRHAILTEVLYGFSRSSQRMLELYLKFDEIVSFRVLSNSKFTNQHIIRTCIIRVIETDK